MTHMDLLEKLIKIYPLVNSWYSEKALHSLNMLIADLKLEDELITLSRESKRIAKAAFSFAKSCYKEHADGHDGIAGANYYHHLADEQDITRQYVTDGYIGVSYSKPFASLIEANHENAIDFDRILFPRDNTTYKRIQLPSLEELKRGLKENKKFSTNGKNLVRFPSGKVFQIEYLIRIMELTGCTGGEEVSDVDNLLRPMYIHTATEYGNEIDAVILPIRIVHPENEHFCIDYMKQGA